MFCSERGTGRTSGATLKRQPHRVPGRRVGVLPHDEHPHVGQRQREGPQHAVAGRQVAATGRHLGAQELAHLGDRVRHRLERRDPRRVDEVAKGSGWHGLTLPPPDVRQNRPR